MERQHRFLHERRLGSALRRARGAPCAGLFHVFQLSSDNMEYGT